MARRRHLTNATSSNIFTKTAYKTNARNLVPSVMQGGYRL